MKTAIALLAMMSCLNSQSCMASVKDVELTYCAGSMSVNDGPWQHTECRALDTVTCADRDLSKTERDAEVKLEEACDVLMRRKDKTSKEVVWCHARADAFSKLQSDCADREVQQHIDDARHLIDQNMGKK